jgi:hypothetical protein
VKDKTIAPCSVVKGHEQPFASKYRTVLPTEGERERRFIERKQNGG